MNIEHTTYLVLHYSPLSNAWQHYATFKTLAEAQPYIDNPDYRVKRHDAILSNGTLGHYLTPIGGSITPKGVERYRRAAKDTTKNPKKTKQLAKKAAERQRIYEETCRSKALFPDLVSTHGKLRSGK